MRKILRGTFKLTMQGDETVTIVEDSTREVFWLACKHNLTVPLLSEYLTAPNFNGCQIQP